MDTYDQLAARLVIAGIKGTVASPEELALVKRGIGGVILFARNVKDPEQVATLSKQLKAAAPGPLLISIDQEGGRVQRLRPPHWTALPSMAQVGELAKHHKHAAHGEKTRLTGAQLATQLGQLMAKELNACGIDQNYAPVVDVNTNPNNPVIGDRSFGPDEKQVAQLGIALATAMEKAGVASCAKHYPGHGDTSQDSHHTLPRLSHDLARLWECELVPFMAAARANLASIMTAHVVFEGFDDLPATLSPKAIQLLRKEIGFGGAILSDDLEMAAIAREVGVLDGAGLAIEAGCDGVLVCHTLELQHEVIDAIARAGRSGPLLHGRLQAAAGHMATLLKFAKTADQIDPSKAAAQCGTAESRAWVESLGASAPHPGAVAHGSGPLHGAHDPTERRA
jgi:beta-N-acetylhexosaminidase